jgi:hypothetical protein
MGVVMQQYNAWDTQMASDLENGEWDDMVHRNFGIALVLSGYRIFTTCYSRYIPCSQAA